MSFTDTCLTGSTLTQLTLVGVNRVRHQIVTCAPPYAMAGGATFRGMTPYAVTSRALGPSIPGEEITNIRAVPRNMVIPIIVRGTTETAFDTALGGLEALLASIQGPCQIIYQRADGTSREITATYIGGAENLAVHDLTRERHVVANCLFRAHYPFWRAVNNSVGNDTGNFTTAQSAGSNPRNINNTGDVESWPEIILTGPVDNAEMANITTGQLFRMREVLAAGETVRIETDPRSRGVWLGDEWRPDVLDPSVAELWPLLPGINRMMFRAASPGNAGTWNITWPLLYGTC